MRCAVQVYDQPISKAAKVLGVGVTVLKKRCRFLKIGRWPFRKLLSLDHMLGSLKECVDDPGVVAVSLTQWVCR
jgi:RWP-RK domain